MIRKKIEASTTQISKIFELMNPNFLSSHLQEQFVVLCHDDQHSSLPKFIGNFIRNSMNCFFDTLIPERSDYVLSNPNFHKETLSNLIVSCRQEIQEKQLGGSCSICICYRVKNMLICVKSAGLETYLLNEEHNRLRSVCGSIELPVGKRNRRKQKIPGYFSISMTKARAEYIFESLGGENQLKFEAIILPETKTPCRILIGSYQSFAYFTLEYIIQYFKENEDKSDCEKANGLLEEAKKKIRTIHQQSICLTCWKT